MSKKKSKNKVNTYARQKLDERQHKNEYFRRLTHICNLIHPDLVRMLMPVQMTTIYLARGTSLRIVADGKVNSEVLAFANEHVRIIQRDVKIPLLKDGDAMISVGEYHHIVSPLEWMIRPGAPREPVIRPNPELFVGIPWYEAFFAEREERFAAYRKAMFTIKATISFFLSDHRYELYYATYKSDTKDANHPFEMKMRQVIHILPHRPERRRIKLLNGEMRIGMRCTLVFPPNDKDGEEQENLAETKFFPLVLPRVIFGLKVTRTKEALPVYVTEHTLNRLEERIGCGSQGYIQAEMIYSLVALMQPDHKPIRIGGGRMLVEFLLKNLKVGYLVVSIQDDAVLIRTFLLMTNHTTPEGSLLHRQLGLEKLDKQYLGIDRLSTFVHSDILQHEDICELFRHAGCSSLIELSDKLKDDFLWEQDSEQIQLAARMREYLKKGESDEEWALPDEDEDESEDESEGESEGV
ncbi:MAG: hypothetical protein LBT78_09135 [Tannerella sp.]|nr:hypothetical protein [Tannerella sp.]